MRRSMLRSILTTCLVFAAILPARALDRVTFGLDWLAEAEYGGYYQAVATGLYAKHGLDVTIRQGGPQVNQTQLMMGGKLDFIITGNAFLCLNIAQEKLPFTTVASMFQRDPTVLLAHPGVGHDSFEQLRGQPIMIGAATRTSWWNFLASKYGYTDAQIRPYTFNLAPFLADKNAVQQGYLGSEPFEIKAKGGFDPVVLLLADTGFNGYASLITTSDKLITEHPDQVQRFIDASIEGWASYLDGDPTPGNALIKQANPDMPDDLLAYGRNVLKSRGIVNSGDGIGAMTDARWEAFSHAVQAEGLYKPDLDWHRAYTLQFVKK